MKKKTAKKKTPNRSPWKREREFDVSYCKIDPTVRSLMTRAKTPKEAKAKVQSALNTLGIAAIITGHSVPGKE